MREILPHKYVFFRGRENMVTLFGIERHKYVHEVGRVDPIDFVQVVMDGYDRFDFRFLCERDRFHAVEISELRGVFGAFALFARR